MGLLHAIEMANDVHDGLMSKDDALIWHLSFNHFPSVSLSFLPAVKRAIRNAEAGQWNKKVKLPTKEFIETWRIIEGLHLDSFLEVYE